MENLHKQWLENRKKGIGGSDAAIVMGLSPYKTNQQLWAEKTGRAEAEDISDKPCVKYGKEAEEYLRELFKLDYPEYEVDYDEFGMIANNAEMPFCFATLDGDLTEIETGRKGILEIKTTQIFSPLQWKHWDNKIPDYYYCQILHQLLATGYDFAILKAQIKYTNKQGEKCATVRHYWIEREEVTDDLLSLANSEKKFWECVKENKEPSLILPSI